MPWQKGQSGNPEGRRAENGIIKRLARIHAEKAIQVLADTLDNGKPEAKVQAAKELLDRAFGRSPQFIETQKANPLDAFSADELRAIASGTPLAGEGGTGDAAEAGDVPTLQ